MSEQQAPDRTIRGFGAARSGGGVHPDASRLLARNRASAPASPSTVATTAAPATPSATGGPALAGASTPVESQRVPPRREAQQTSPGTAIKAQINVMVASDLRARVRSAYRATSGSEGHRSFSDFVASLLEAEAERLETQYNGGQRFEGGEQPLPPGRPLDP